MKIKDRLGLYFTLISTLTLLGVLTVVYFTFLKVMEAEFYDRLTDRTMVTAKLYLEADEISSDALDKVREKYLESLNSEVIRIYNDRNSASFIGDDEQFWTNNIINKVRKAGKLRFKEGDRQVVGIFYKDNQGDFVILASAIDKGTAIRISKLLKVMIGVFVVIFIGLLFCGRWIAKRMLSPLTIFMEQVKMIKSNNLHYRVDEGRNNDEITLLARSFNNLMEHLEHSFILQKTFVANASHELRTPVTRMVISAELALSRDRDIPAYKGALSSVLEDAEKLDQIITALLKLAQADLEYSAALKEAVRIDELLWQMQSEWNALKGNGSLQINMINMPDTIEPLTIHASYTLLQIALDNIIGNAFKFSADKTVTCTMEVNPSGIILVIKDQGMGISSEVLPEIFKPFYTNSGESGQEGHGMGLYLAHKIITLFRGTITAASNPGEGTSFTVTFAAF